MITENQRLSIKDQQEVLAVLIHAAYAKWISEMVALTVVNSDGSLSLASSDALRLIGRAGTLWHELSEPERQDYRDYIKRSLGWPA